MRGVSSVRVFYWALGGASARHGFKARHVLFRADGVVSNNRCGKEKEKMIKRIFAVSGVKDSGKTHTLNYLAQLFNTAGTRVHGPDPMVHPLNTDIQYIFDVNLPY